MSPESKELVEAWSIIDANCYMLPERAYTELRDLSNTIGGIPISALGEDGPFETTLVEDLGYITLNEQLEYDAYTEEVLR